MTVARRLHPLDAQTLLWMRARENETGRAVSPQAVAMFRDWTVGGAQSFLRRMKREGLIDSEGMVADGKHGP